jgi:hypothetical protein
MRRRPASRGLSYFDANSRRLITEGPDVCEIKNEILARWPGWLTPFFDTWEEEWVIVEHCKDGTDRLALTTKELNRSILDRLMKMDQATHDIGDVAIELEKQADKVDKDKEHEFSEKLGDGLERLEHSLQDVLLHNPKIFVSSSV